MCVVAPAVAPAFHKMEIGGYGPPLSQGRRIRLRARPRPHGHCHEKFQTRENLFPETGPITSRNSAQRRRSLLPQSTGVVVAPSLPAEVRRSLNPSGDDPCQNALHFCPPPPLARWF